MKVMLPRCLKTFVFQIRFSIILISLGRELRRPHLPSPPGQTHSHPFVPPFSHSLAIYVLLLLLLFLPPRVRVCVCVTRFGFVSYSILGSTLLVFSFCFLK